MLLNLDLIQDNLPESYPVKRYGPRQRELCFRRPVLYEQGKAMASDALYIARSGSLPELPPQVKCGVICIGQRLPRAWTMHALPVLLLQGELSAIGVFNAVNSIFDSFDSWDAALRDALEKEEDFRLEELMCLAAQRLPYRIGITDSGLSTMIMVESITQSDGTTTIQVSHPAQPMPMDYSEQVKQVCRLERTIRVPYLTGVNLEGKNYCNNIYLADHFVGCAAIGMDQGDFRESDYPLMDRFFSYFRKGYIKHLRLSTQVEKAGLETLRKLITHTGVSDRELEALQGQEDGHWAVFLLRERLGEQSYPREYMRASLNAISPTGIYAVIHRESLTGLLRCSDDREAQQALFQKFSALASRMGYQCGVSNPFSQLRQVYAYLPQAAFSATKAQEQGLELCQFESCTLDYLLESCLGDMTLEAMLGPGLRKLQHHDKTKGTQYLKTLNVYLQQEMSIVHTAQALFIHRSSLLKRLDKIQRLLEDDLTDPRKRLYYRICLELMELA